MMAVFCGAWRKIVSSCIEPLTSITFICNTFPEGGEEVRLTIKGQVTVPLRVRKYLEVGPRDEVSFLIDEGRVLLVKGEEPGDDLVKQLNKMKGSGNGRMTTDEIMQFTRGE
ncbi:MAG: hypothetical protein LBT15_06725 [Synergistaceae bacterium]|jgi:bifunctional DNA-binding transcriptional regulator/antitoxin component of YhaV-PrlF toxin-antitoxin module|nr:hypothetical protein [Synergistaceae bacterium]